MPCSELGVARSPGLSCAVLGLACVRMEGERTALRRNSLNEHCGYWLHSWLSYHA